MKTAYSAGARFVVHWSRVVWKLLKIPEKRRMHSLLQVCLLECVGDKPSSAHDAAVDSDMASIS